jgi:hypothetical protein
LYPRKENKEPVDKGKSTVITKKKEWVPLRSNPFGIGSSNAFAALALAETHTQDAVPVKDVASNSFSFALQNVTDEVPQCVLALVDEPVLTLVINAVHDNVQLRAAGKMLPVSDVTLSPVAYVILSHFDEHVDVQEETDEETLIIIPTRSASPPPAHSAIPDDSSATTLDFNSVSHDGGYVSAIQLVVPDGATMDDVNRSSIVREEGMTHSNACIQQDLNLWQRIKDYD